MIHIQRFVERIQGFEARGQKDYIMSIKDAKDLHTDITKLLLALEELRTQPKNNPDNEVITVNMDGGTFK